MPVSARVDKALVDLIASCELVDVWKKLRGNERGQTFIHTRRSFRIDRFLTGRSSPITFQTIQTYPTIFTDHFALVTKLRFDNPNMSQSRPTRVALWKLNTSILEEEEYQLCIQQFVSNAVKASCELMTSLSGGI